MLHRNLNNNISLSLDVKYLWFITLSYAMLNLLSSWFVLCSISLQTMTANAGTLLFPINLLTANFIAEVYGYKNARRAIWCGFFFNLFCVFYALCIINLPSPSYALHNPLFNSIITTYLKTSFFFILSYLITEPVNLFLFAKLKLKLKGNYLKFRLLSCVFVSLLLNNIILYLTKYIDNLIHIQICSMLLISTLITLISLPVICFFIKKVKKLEKIDIYDQNTQFNFFKFEVYYILSNNRFTKLTS